MGLISHRPSRWWQLQEQTCARVRKAQRAHPGQLGAQRVRLRASSDVWESHWPSLERDPTQAIYSKSTAGWSSVPRADSHTIISTRREVDENRHPSTTVPAQWGLPENAGTLRGTAPGLSYTVSFSRWGGCTIWWTELGHWYLEGLGVNSGSQAG